MVDAIIAALPSPQNPTLGLESPIWAVAANTKGLGMPHSMRERTQNRSHAHHRHDNQRRRSTFHCLMGDEESHSTSIGSPPTRRVP